MKRFHKILAVMAIVAGITGTTAVLVHAVAYDPEPELTDAQAHASAASVPAALPADYPVRLIIPGIRVDAGVQRVGIAYSGHMGIPTNFTDAGWYKYGVAPGEKGTAVIDGHVDNALALPGVFKHLSDLKKGDDIYIVRQDGTKLRFRVSGTEVLDHDASSAEVLSGNGGAELKLITCEGAWDQAGKTYDHRLVVTAVYEGKV